MSIYRVANDIFGVVFSENGQALGNKCLFSRIAAGMTGGRKSDSLTRLNNVRVTQIFKSSTKGCRNILKDTRYHEKINLYASAYAYNQMWQIKPRFP
jgi:hypothetical protein